MDVSRKPHSLTQTFKIVLLLLTILACIFTFDQIQLSQYFPIKTVRVFGLQHVDRDEVQTLLLPIVDTGFFNVHVEQVRERLMQMPWVADIFVRRIWPDKIEITIKEKAAMAKWNGGILLSQTGELFSPKLETYPGSLPIFIGPEGKHIVMLQYFNEINRLLEPLRVKISYLEMTPFLTWKLKLDNGITLQIGHKDILTRLGQFVKVYPKIVGNRAAAVDCIDLRYSNGMAVRWREAQLAHVNGSKQSDQRERA